LLDEGVAGDNVGLAPLADSTYAVVAQPTRLALIDLSAAQGRDGLPLSSETVPPGTLRGLMAAAGESGPVALTEDGRAYCVRAVPPSPQARAVLPVPPPKPSEAAPSTPPPAPPEEPPEVEEAPVETRPEPPPETAPVPPPPVPVPEKPPESSGAATTRSVFGQLTGPSLSEVAAVVFLGPDNILHEAARVVPDGDGRYETSGLAAGAYRIVAAGKAGRVLLCDPSFITVHVGANGAVEAPVLKVLHAP